MALSDGRACKKYVSGNSDKIVVPLIWAKSQKINQIQTHSWYSSWPYAYRWDADQYMVHIYCLKVSNGT